MTATTTTSSFTPVRLHGPEHAADPQRSYELLRAQGPVGLAEIDEGVHAYVVTDYRAALDLLRDTETWSKDTRPWLHRVPETSAVRPMVEWRPSVFFADGAEHDRLRTVITDSFALLDPDDVRRRTFRYADELLRGFAAEGRADLVSQYAVRLPLMVFNALFGMPDAEADDLIHALTAMVDGDESDKAKGAQTFQAYLSRLYTSKLSRRGQDLTSWYLDHPNGLDQDEVVNQVLITLGAGNEPLANLIANTLLRLLTDERYFSDLSTGGLPVQSAIHESLWADAPLATYSLHIARRDVAFHGVLIPVGSPVMVSYAAANTCPYAGAPTEGQRSGPRAHLSFAAGPHTCPAQSTALLVATAAVERLLGFLPDIEIAVPKEELTYRPSPVHRSLSALPVTFTALHPQSRVANPWSARTAAVPDTP
ncbi:cytochrome P450 family protein [Phaeacidiphilus oryzae]|uniref:cytochrome P450 n=1 Tax=Phaeacidiphilus oryzae TaxID=348818 RepID=UPI000690BEA2|nr:cytochrome P450 [Phaeacidiphilus oryzae]